MNLPTRILTGQITSVLTSVVVIGQNVKSVSRRVIVSPEHGSVVASANTC